MTSAHFAGVGQKDTIAQENRVTITPLLIRAAPRDGSNGSKTAADTAAAADEADGAQEPATKKPRHEAAEAAGSGGASSGGRGMASVHSSAGVQSAVACYVCQLATIPGKFDPQKAAQLGVPRGPVSLANAVAVAVHLCALPFAPYQLTGGGVGFAFGWYLQLSA